MPEIKRILDLLAISQIKSVLLFGPRATGKSFLLKKLFPNSPVINLLKAKERLHYLENPSLLEDFARAHPKNPIIIDEIQLVPDLLHEVHSLIEDEGRTFVITGSSARKLKREGANLLAGRAKTLSLFPLNWYELQNDKHFDLHRYLQFGGLPTVYLNENPQDQLSDYVDTYLTEEIKAEANIRNIMGFEKFLSQVAIRSGEIINYSKIANDIQLSPPTIREYYQILEDTLLGFFLTPWQGSKRKAVQTAKFYFFDLGVTAFLARIEALPEQSNLFGMYFEHFIVLEIRSYLSYRRRREKMYFWRTNHQEEVDIIIDDKIAIEIKSAKKVSSRDGKNLLRLKEEGDFQKLILISRDPIRRNDQDIEYWPYDEFLKALWNDLVFQEK